MNSTGLLDHLLSFIRKHSGHVRLEALDIIDQTLYKLSIVLEDLFSVSRALDSKPVLFAKKVKEIVLFHYLQIDTGLDTPQSEKNKEFNRVMNDLLTSCETSRHSRHDFVMGMRKTHQARVQQMLELEAKGKTSSYPHYNTEGEAAYLYRTEKYEATHGDFARCCDTAQPCGCTQGEKEENALSGIEIQHSEFDISRPERKDFKKAALFKKATAKYDEQVAARKADQVKNLDQALDKEASELHPGGGTVTWQQHMPLQYTRDWLWDTYKSKDGTETSYKESAIGNYVSSVGKAMSQCRNVDFKEVVKCSLSGQNPEDYARRLTKETE